MPPPRMFVRNIVFLLRKIPRLGREGIQMDPRKSGALEPPQSPTLEWTYLLKHFFPVYFSKPGPPSKMGRFESPVLWRPGPGRWAVHALNHPICQPQEGLAEADETPHAGQPIRLRRLRKDKDKAPLIDFRCRFDCVVSLSLWLFDHGFGYFGWDRECYQTLETIPIHIRNSLLMLAMALPRSIPCNRNRSRPFHW